MRFVRTAPVQHPVFAGNTRTQNVALQGYSLAKVSEGVSDRCMYMKEIPWRNIDLI